MTMNSESKKPPGADGDFLPIFLDMRSRKVVIFGGGQVATRKARFFAGHARVTVVSMDFSRGLKELEMDGTVELVVQDLSSGAEQYLEGAFIAIPATSDRDLNVSLGEAASRRGVLVDTVDGAGDLIIPSLIRRGPVNVAISTQGESPALSRYLRMKLEADLPPESALMARLISGLREELKLSVSSQKERKAILWSVLLDQEVWRLLPSSYEKAYMRAREHLSPDERNSLDAGDPP